MRRLTVKIPRLFTDGVTKTEAMKAWIAGYMGKARKRRRTYSSQGIREIIFVKGRLRMIRKI